jgi:hypothetical protein
MVNAGPEIRFKRTKLVTFHKEEIIRDSEMLDNVEVDGSDLSDESPFVYETFNRTIFIPECQFDHT